MANFRIHTAAEATNPFAQTAAKGTRTGRKSFPCMSDAPGNQLKQRLKRIGAYTALALVLLPVMIVEPLKVVGVWVAGKGHWLTGTFVVAAAYAASLLVVDKLFHILKPNILRAPVLAKVWRGFLGVWSTGRQLLCKILPSSG
jgi:hypothetical protein